MSSAMNVQSRYRCYSCKSASDIYGRGCKHGLMFPVLLLMANIDRCENYEYDPAKAQDRLLEIEKQDKTR